MIELRRIHDQDYIVVDDHIYRIGDSYTIGANGTRYDKKQVKLTVATDPSTGKKKQKCYKSDTPEGLLEQINKDRYTYGVRFGVDADSKITVGDLTERYLATDGMLEPATRHSHRMYAKHINRYFGNTPALQLTQSDILNFQADLKGKNLGCRYINQIVSCLNRILELGKQDRLIFTNPCARVRKLHGTVKEQKAFPEEGIDALLDEFENDWYGPVCGFSLSLAIRIGEGIGLSWDAVDEAGGFVSICQHAITNYMAHRREIMPGRKNHDNLRLCLTSLAYHYLDLARMQQKELREKLGTEWTNPDNLVFLNPNGEMMRDRTVREHLHKMCAAAGLETSGTHDLRRTAATSLYNATGDIYMVSKLIGDRSPDAVVSYIKPVDSMLRKISDAQEEIAEKYMRFPGAAEGRHYAGLSLQSGEWSGHFVRGCGEAGFRIRYHG